VIMATIPPKANEAELAAFLELAGRSLSEAQGALGSAAELRAEMVLASAELEAKVALRADPSGRLAVQPVSASDLRLAQFNAAGVSTLRVSFVAAAGAVQDGATQSTGSGTTGGATPGTGVGSGGRPVRKPEEIAEGVRKRPDVAALENILGPFSFETTYVDAAQRWIVLARDAKGRVVRETMVPDRDLEQ
jgi:hypothetical protein